MDDLKDCDTLKKLYDKRIYELDTYKSILSKVGGFDYRYPQSVNLSTQDDDGDSIETSPNKNQSKYQFLNEVD